MKSILVGMSVCGLVLSSFGNVSAEATVGARKVVAQGDRVASIVPMHEGERRPLWLMSVSADRIECSQIAASSGMFADDGQLVETPWGPMTWGVVGSDFYSIRQSGGFSSSQIQIAAERLPGEMWLRAWGEDRTPQERMQAQGELLNNATALFLKDLFFEIAGPSLSELQENWDLFYDMNYVENDRFDLFRARRGELRWWSYQHDVDEHPVERGRVETVINRSFRALRSGDRLVLVDEDGRVFSSPREGHALIGQIANWPTDEETDRDVYLLEDATTHELRIVEVVEEQGDGNGGGGKRIVRSLAFDEDKDNSHGNPFTAELPREEIQQALIRLTEAIEDGGDRDGSGRPEREVQ